MLDIGIGEFLALAVIALLVLGPDKLPKFAADTARFVRQVRQMANNAKEDVRRELGPELQDISLDDLNPRSIMRKHLLDDLDDMDDEPVRRESRREGSQPHRVDGRPGQTSPPYDPDAT
jgi:sec-independent protein translocase protein TatB